MVSADGAWFCLLGFPAIFDNNGLFISISFVNRMAYKRNNHQIKHNNVSSRKKTSIITFSKQWIDGLFDSMQIASLTSKFSKKNACWNSFDECTQISQRSIVSANWHEENICMQSRKKPLNNRNIENKIERKKTMTKEKKCHISLSWKHCYA